MSGYDQFVRGVHATLLILALAATAGIVWIERDIHETMLALHPSITYGEQTIKIVGGAATDLEKTLRTERQASADQLAAAAQGQQKLESPAG